MPCAALSCKDLIMEGAVRKSMSATHMGKTPFCSGVSHLYELVPRRVITVSKSYFIAFTFLFSSLSCRFIFRNALLACRFPSLYMPSPLPETWSSEPFRAPKAHQEDCATEG